MKSDKKQTMALIGIALLTIAGVLIYISLKQPRVYETVVETVSVSNQEVSVQNGADAVSKENEKEDGDTTSAVSYRYPINLNTATLDELMSISGLGETRAGAILEYRDYLGKYTSVEQIKNIQGISDAIYGEVAGYLTV